MRLTAIRMVIAAAILGLVACGSTPTTSSGTRTPQQSRYVFVASPTEQVISTYAFDPAIEGLRAVRTTPLSFQPRHLTMDSTQRFLVAQSGLVTGVFKIDPGSGELSLAAQPQRCILTQQVEFSVGGDALFCLSQVGIGNIEVNRLNRSTGDLVRIGDVAMADTIRIAVDPAGRFVAALRRINQSGRISGELQLFRIDLNNGTAPLSATGPSIVLPAASEIEFGSGGGVLYAMLEQNAFRREVRTFAVAGTGQLTDIGSPVFWNVPVGVSGPAADLKAVPSHPELVALADDQLMLIRLDTQGRPTGAPANIDVGTSSIAVDDEGARLFIAGSTGGMRSSRFESTNARLSETQRFVTRWSHGDVVVTTGAAPVRFQDRFVFVPGVLNNRVTSFTVDWTNGGLVRADSLPTGGSLATSVAATPNGRSVFVGHRLSPDFFVTRVDANTGRFSGTGNLVNAGGPVADLDVDPSGTCLVVLRTNPSALLSFAIDPGTGQLGVPVTIAPGIGSPSAVRFDPTGDNLYVLSGGDGRVAVFPTVARHASASQSFEARSIAPAPSSVSSNLSGASGGASRMHLDLAGSELYTFDHAGRLVISERLGGLLNPSNTDTVAFPPAEALRALALAPHRRHLYAITEEVLAQTGVLRLFLQAPANRTSRPITPGTQATLRGSVRPSDAQVDASGNWLRVLDESNEHIFIYPLDPSTGLPLGLTTTADSSGVLRTEVSPSITLPSNGRAMEFRAVWTAF